MFPKCSAPVCSCIILSARIIAEQQLIIVEDVRPAHSLQIRLDPLEELAHVIWARFCLSVLDVLWFFSTSHDDFTSS
jgi:hypothetical protein